MADVKLVRAYDPYAKDSHAFSIVADSNNAEFIFPKDNKLFDGEQRISFLLDNGAKKPTSSDGWAKLAMSGLSSFTFKFINTDGGTLSDIADAEISYIKELVDNSVGSYVPPKESYDVEVAVKNLMRSDEEIANYLEDPSVGLSLEKRKMLMATMIIAADTVEYNPWLLPWLNGEELDPKDVDTTLVLSKPFKADIDSESLVNYEGDDE